MKEHCNAAAIPLTQGQYAIVDIEDFEWLNQWKWHAHKNNIKYITRFYAIRSKRQGKKIQKIFMHRLIINPSHNLQIDHINGNTLNNQKSNLRIATNRQNQQNRHHPKTSKYTGVSWKKDHRKWQAQIYINGKVKFLGYFDDEYEAYLKYEKAESDLMT